MKHFLLSFWRDFTKNSYFENLFFAKIYLYKEDFADFKDNLEEMINYILDEKGEEVISERHQKDYKKEDHGEDAIEATETSNFTDVDFDDI